MKETLGLEGRFHVLHYREGKLLGEYTFKNKITTASKEYVLNSALAASIQWSGFYVGLLDDTFTTFTSDAPTISGEFTDYDEATRPEWEPGTADTSGGYSYIQNDTDHYATFTVSTGVTAQDLNGIYIGDGSTKASTPTNVWCTAAFGNNDSTPVAITVNAADVLKVQYTVRIAT